MSTAALRRTSSESAVARTSLNTVTASAFKPWMSFSIVSSLSIGFAIVLKSIAQRQAPRKLKAKLGNDKCAKHEAYIMVWMSHVVCFQIRWEMFRTPENERGVNKG